MKFLALYVAKQMKEKKLFCFVCVAVYILTLVCVRETMAFKLKLFKINTPLFKAQEYKEVKYRFSEPQNYSGTVTDDTQYPLIVYLHGAGERGSDNRQQSLNLSYLGNGFNRQAKSFRENHPCFVFVPQCPRNETWNGDILTELTSTIEYLIEKYSISRSQLYVIGYSMGGSGAYSLAERYYVQTGQVFAGVIRIAGQGSFQPRLHEIIAKSAVWLHIGLQDTELRVEKAREAYALLKENVTKSLETIEKGRLAGVEFETHSLKVDGREHVKLTEYSGVGHGINIFPFKDKMILPWLFSQKAIIDQH